MNTVTPGLRLHSSNEYSTIYIILPIRCASVLAFTDSGEQPVFQTNWTGKLGTLCRERFVENEGLSLG